MGKNKINHNAGKIWQTIIKNQNIKISDLKKLTQLDIKDLYLALGWLAKDNKVYFSQKERELEVCLMG